MNDPEHRVRQRGFFGDAFDGDAGDHESAEGVTIRVRIRRPPRRRAIATGLVQRARLRATLRLASATDSRQSSRTRR